MTNTLDTQLKNSIMKKVYFIYYCRIALSKIALQIYLVLILTMGLIKEVSISDVFQNSLLAGQSGLGGITSYSSHAFLNSELLVQSMFSITILFIIFIMAKSFRKVIAQKRS